MTTVLPTHTCFDDAVEIMVRILKAHPDALHTDEFVIVHAIVQPEDKAFAHAWIQSQESVVFWIGIIDGERCVLGTPAAEWYANYKPREITRYSPMEAYRQEKRTGKYGPWEEKYVRLCSADRAPMGSFTITAGNR